MAIDWMETLEKRVREAAEEIRRLRAENAALEQRVEALAAELAEARQDADGESSEPAPERDAAWEHEREEVRQRVERLVKQLEGLIQEAETTGA